ncbi:MAG TPA: 2-oxo acid dehydrogenase subunit E2 [Vicinamibacterales bacterium]|nr:2-oxo acid dehydrogenase subunit E2 [Vicinamibacterales bacterium]
MPTPLHTPRVNNNDDTVRLVKLLVKTGDEVREGQLVAEVETDKANFTVESDRDGYVLAVQKSLNDTVEVGSVLLWLGTSIDETVPTTASATRVSSEPTLKAAQLLAQHGLSASDIPSSGDRLTVADIERFLALQNTSGPTNLAGHSIAEGVSKPLTPEERGMLRTVSWQRDEAVPGYVELAYDAAAWDRAAADYQKRENLLLSPLLALLAHRLARLAAENPALNSTIVSENRHEYREVNVGFTVQSDSTLYLTVVRNAAALGCREFIERLGRLQRGALAHTLRAPDLTGATISFSSMARWSVSRHVPVLPPYTSLIVAHAASRDGVGTLGATYDHRVLTGYDAVNALRQLATPEEQT